MIDKGSLISNALARLGNISEYNDDRSRTYEAAESLVSLVIRKVCSDSGFNFSVSKVKLTLYGQDSDGEYKYNLPVNFLGIAKKPRMRRSVSSRILPAFQEASYNEVDETRLQGEFIYSNKSDLTIFFNKKLPITELPDYAFDYIVWKLATEMALMYPQFTERLQYCELKASEAMYNIQKSEGLGVVYYG